MEPTVNHSDRARASAEAGARVRRLRRALALIAAALPLATTAVAQEPQPPAKPTSAPESVAIPLVEVSQRAEKTAQVINSAIDSLPPDASFAPIAAKLPAMERSLRERRAELERAIASLRNRDRLSELQADWTETGKQLDGWRGKLDPLILKIEAALDSLDHENDVWERTRQSAEGAQTPDRIVKRIQATLQSIDDAITTVSNKRARLLTLQDRVVQQSLVATAAIDQIQTALREGRRNLFERESPPLWADLRQIQPGEHLEAVRTSIDSDLRNLREFAAASGSRFLLDLLVFILVLRYALAVKRRLVHPADGIPPIGGAGELFERPLAIALLATALAARWIHGAVPVAFTTIIACMLIVPFVRLVPLLLPAQMRWVVWVMASLVVVSRTRLIVSEAPLASEVLLGIELIGMTATLLWLMRPSRLREIPLSGPVPPLLGIGMRVWLLLLALSILSSALGFREFGSVIGTATGSSVYAALILYAAVGATRAAVEASFHTAPAQKLSFVRRRRDAVLRITSRYASVVAAIYWIYLTLNWFELFDPLSTRVRSILTAHLDVGEIQTSIGDVIAFVLTVAVAFLLSRLIRFFLEEEAFPRMRLRRGVGNAVSTLLHYAILLLGFVFALSAAGMDFSRVVLFAGAFSVGVGFGLQNVVNNFVSGLILLFERPIQIGDMVEIGGLLGEVRRIGARSSTVRTADGAEVIVPNANLISEQVVNWTLSDRRRRIVVDVGVAYGTDPETVLEILRTVATNNPSVLDDPAPEALFQGFGDSALNFRLRSWIPRFEDYFEIQSQLGVGINAALRDAGISIPFPQRDLHLRSVESPVLQSLKDRPPE